LLRKISIYNSFIQQNQENRDYLTDLLKENGFSTSRNGELLMVLGGDGTFLSAVRKRFKQNPIFVGFNTGNLGYFSEFTIEDAPYFLEILKTKNYWIQNVPVYEVRYKDGTEEVMDFFINDLVLERKSTRILHMGIDINDKPFCTASSDGIIISTTVGSTGYNLSAGGSICVECGNLLQLTPIAPVLSKAYHSLQHPVVVHDHCKFTLYPNFKKARSFRVVCDGRELKTNDVESIEISKTNRFIRILRSERFQSLKNIQHKIFDISYNE
jgi:NAD+ kinase